MIGTHALLGSSSTPSVSSSQCVNKVAHQTMASSAAMVAALPMSSQMVTSTAMTVPSETSETYMMPGSRERPQPTWVIEEVIDFGLPADESVREVDDEYRWEQR